MAKNPLLFQLEGFENVVSVAAGPGYVLSAKEDGSVWAFGSNYFDELTNRDYGYEVYPPIKVEGVPRKSKKPLINFLRWLSYTCTAGG